MNSNALYESIFRRKSVRNYDSTPINQDLLERISENLHSLKPMLGGIKTEFRIISAHDVTRKFRINAPHYIAAFSEAKELYKTNVGFVLQQMDLYFSSIGLGSCWLGIPQPTKEVMESSNLEFVILISFGNSKETLYRTDVSQFKREALSKITNIEGADELLEPVRLAPSAVNQQNWYFAGTKNLIQAYSSKSSFLRSIVGGSYFPVNVGIALCHLQIAAEHLGRKTKFVFGGSIDTNPPKNREYVATLEVDKAN
jgi:nitroreductase